MTMSHFSQAELEAMRDTQDGAMQDVCRLMTYSRTFNSYGEPVEVWADGTTDIICGLEMKPGTERSRDTMTVIEYDAILRLPIGTTLDEKDRIEVVSRYGEDITAQVYRIAAPIQRGPSGIRILLNQIEL